MFPIAVAVGRIPLLNSLKFVHCRLQALRCPRAPLWPHPQLYPSARSVGPLVGVSWRRVAFQGSDPSRCVFLPTEPCVQMPALVARVSAEQPLGGRQRFRPGPPPPTMSFRYRSWSKEMTIAWRHHAPPKTPTPPGSGRCHQPRGRAVPCRGIGCPPTRDPAAPRRPSRPCSRQLAGCACGSRPRARG